MKYLKILQLHKDINLYSALYKEANYKSFAYKNNLDLIFVCLFINLLWYYFTHLIASTHHIREYRIHSIVFLDILDSFEKLLI